MSSGDEIRDKIKVIERTGILPPEVPVIAQEKYAYTVFTDLLPIQVTSDVSTVADLSARVFGDDSTEYAIFPEAVIKKDKIHAIAAGWKDIEDDEEDDEDDVSWS